jgi:hypothetical protein
VALQGEAAFELVVAAAAGHLDVGPPAQQLGARQN